MLVFLLLLCALVVIILLIQFTLYSRSLRKELSANTALTEKGPVIKCNNISLAEERDATLQPLPATDMQR